MSNKKKGGFYPSKRQAETTSFQDLIMPQSEVELDLSAPFRVSDSNVPLEKHQEWQKRFKDEWVNQTASVNANNAIGTLSEFFINRLSYFDCASLSTDTIILKAINTISNEIFNKGGDFIILDEDVENKDEVLEAFNNHLERLKFWDTIKEASKKSLIFGTSFIYASSNITNDKLETPLNLFDLNAGSNQENKILSLRVIEPYLLGAYEVESVNPLSDYYMKPTHWYVSGAGKVHHSRLFQLSFFEVPDIIKPVFNYGGISLCQMMRSYVRDANNIRQSLAELFLRFRTMIIKTPMPRTNPQEAVKRAKNIALSKNNLGLLLLNEMEDYIETITPITGLDKIQSQAFENMTISSGLPATKLLGISPSGFNSTGEFDLINYYDTISGYQASIIKPLILKLGQGIAYNLGFDIKLDFEFKPLQKLNEKEIAETKAIVANTAIALQEAGILSSEQALEICINEKVVPEHFIAQEEADFLGDDNLE